MTEKISPTFGTTATFTVTGRTIDALHAAAVKALLELIGETSARWTYTLDIDAKYTLEHPTGGTTVALWEATVRAREYDD